VTRLTEPASRTNKGLQRFKHTFYFKAGLVLPVNRYAKRQQIGDISYLSLSLDLFSRARASKIAGVGFFLGFFASLFFLC